MIKQPELSMKCLIYTTHTHTHRDIPVAGLSPPSSRYAQLAVISACLGRLSPAPLPDPDKGVAAILYIASCASQCVVRPPNTTISRVPLFLRT